MEETITFATIYEILRNEKIKDTLQKLPDGFFKNVATYINEKESFAKDNEELEKQIKTIKKMVNELNERRRKKIIEMALNKIKTKVKLEDESNLEEHEKLFFDKLINLLEENNNLFIELIKTGTLQHDKEEKNNNMILVRFLSPIPSFVAEDGLTYGPFDKDEIANLPRKAAEILIKKERAEPIE